MLLSFLSLLIATPAAPAVTMDKDREIVVIGEKFKRWTGKYKIRGDQMKCATKRSTGDKEIDAIGCAAFQTCATKLQTRIYQSDAKDLEKDQRKIMKAEIKEDLTSCVIDRRKDLIANLADKRS